jgi:eukaryotic-like serine/threonine-protein kinase
MPRAPEATGSVLDGRYELHAVVGEGAFGRVYRGRDRRLDRIVAVKVIKPWWAEDPAWADTFEREARLLARVSDPAIVQIFDVGQTREGLYYVAEFVDGESLADRLKRRRLAASEACEIAEQLSRALARAHDQRIVHRDVKPANVLISAEGQVKLGDFGVARLAEGSTGGTAGAVMGTPRYMAPEQARGHKTTPATDVYSVGVVLYEMLAGAPPFSGSGIDLALSHVQDPPPPLPDSIPDELRRIVARALAKDPRARYPDGGGMAAALARASATLPAAGDIPAVLEPSNGHSHSLGPAAQPDPTRVKPKLTPRRNVNPPARRRSVALLGLVCLLLVAMAVAAVLLAPPARVRVPRLAGLAKRAAAARAQRAHLRPSFATRFDAAAPGSVIAQSPAAGARVTEGSGVRVVLSAGPPPVEIPRLVGQPSSSARTVLGSLGLGVRETEVPAPGTQPGIVTGQSPAAGRYLRPHSQVALTVAETPTWRPVTSFSGSGSGASVPFRVRGGRWRIVYHMAYSGTCTLIFFCDGPSARIVRTPTGATVDEFGMSDGGEQTQVVRSGPGVYQVRITPGSDTARWSVEVADYY